MPTIKNCHWPFFFNFLISFKSSRLLINIICRSVHSALSEEHLERGGDDQGAGGGQQRHRLHRRLHRPRTTQPSHHPGQCLFSPSLLNLFSTSPILFLLSSNSCHFLRRAPPPPLLAAPFTSPPLSSTAGQLSIERQPIRPVRAHPTPTSGRDPDLWSPCVHVAGTQAHYHKTYGAHTPSRHLNQDLGSLVGTFYSTTYVQLGDMRFITCTHGTNAPRSHPP